MSSAVKLDEVAEKIMKELEHYRDTAVEVMDKAVADTSKKAVQELRNAHPPESKNWDEYNKGWTATKSKKGKKSSAVVHNKTHYQLTHLLEYGHAKIGEKGGKTREFVHIAPVDEMCAEMMEEAIVNGLAGIK